MLHIKEAIIKKLNKWDKKTDNNIVCKKNNRLKSTKKGEGSGYKNNHQTD